MSTRFANYFSVPVQDKNPESVLAFAHGLHYSGIITARRRTNRKKDIVTIPQALNNVKTSPAASDVTRFATALAAEVTKTHLQRWGWIAFMLALVTFAGTNTTVSAIAIIPVTLCALWGAYSASNLAFEGKDQQAKNTLGIIEAVVWIALSIPVFYL